MHPHGPHGNFYIHDARETIYPRKPYTLRAKSP